MTDEWRDDAECHQRQAAPELFDLAPDYENPTEREGLNDQANRHATALRYCHDCPVISPCLASAIAAHDSGVRGGQVLTFWHQRDGELMNRRAQLRLAKMLDGAA